jgi:hypothetical protein
MPETTQLPRVGIKLIRKDDDEREQLIEAACERFKRGLAAISAAQDKRADDSIGLYKAQSKNLKKTLDEELRRIDPESFDRVSAQLKAEKRLKKGKGSEPIEKAWGGAKKAKKGKKKLTETEQRDPPSGQLKQPSGSQGTSGSSLVDYVSAKPKPSQRDRNDGPGPGQYLGPAASAHSPAAYSSTAKLQKAMWVREQELQALADTECRAMFAKRGERELSAYDARREAFFKGELTPDSLGIKPVTAPKNTAYETLMKLAQGKADVDPEGRSVEVWFSKLLTQSRDPRLRRLAKKAIAPPGSELSDDDEVTPDLDMGVGDLDDDPNDPNDQIDRKASASGRAKGTYPGLDC